MTRCGHHNIAHASAAHVQQSTPCCRSNRSHPRAGYAAHRGGRAARSTVVRHALSTCLSGDTRPSTYRATLRIAGTITNCRINIPIWAIRIGILTRYHEDALVQTGMVAHGAPCRICLLRCTVRPGLCSFHSSLQSDMPLHFRRRLACIQRSRGDEITLSTSPMFAHDVRTLCRLGCVMNPRESMRLTSIHIVSLPASPTTLFCSQPSHLRQSTSGCTPEPP
jgi:hypothetical protein